VSQLASLCIGFGTRRSRVQIPAPRLLQEKQVTYVDALLARRHWANIWAIASTINRAERGETRTLSLDNLEKFVRALSVSPRSLITVSKR